MKVAAKSPSYLVRNPYSYCFRMIVPKDLQKVAGLKELRYSLKTGRLNVTKYKALLLAGQVRSIFQQLRKGCKVSLLTKSTIRINKNDFKSMKYLKEEGVFKNFILVSRDPVSTLANNFRSVICHKMFAILRFSDIFCLSLN